MRLRAATSAPVLFVACYLLLLQSPSSAEAVVSFSDSFDAENGASGQLNYAAFTRWDVPAGAVDLVGDGFEEVYPGNGLYVDLDGSTGAGGVLSTKRAFYLPPGSYTLRFELGNNNVLGGAAANNQMTVSLGSAYSEIFQRSGAVPLEQIERTIVVGSATSGKLVFDHSGSGDNTGLIIDDVELEAPPPPAGFVTAAGGDLELDGQPYKFTGLNVYNANSDGWCWYEMGSGTALNDGLTNIGPGKDAFRAWFFQPLATDGAARNWSRFDHTLSVAAAHGERAIVTLTDQWGECGARGPDGEVSYYKTDDWYTSGYMTPDPGMPSSYRDWVAEVVTRYKDDPTVLMWQLINEAEVKEDVSAGCLPGNGSYTTLRTWAEDVSGLVKSIDPNHLVSLGTIGGGQCGASWTEYQELHSIGTIDVCEYHDYGSPLVPIPGDFWNGLQRRIDQCNALDKPLFIGELGIIPNTAGGTLAARAAAVQAKRDAQFAAGIDGILSWAWSNLGSTLENYDVGPGDPVLETLILNDNCPAMPNPGQQNSDADPLGNACDNCPIIPNAGQENADGDPYGDACDSCPAFATAWSVPAGDGDCDGFTDANEGQVGTLTGDRCASTGVVTGGPGANDEPPPDVWPVDFNDNQIVNTIDVGFFVPRLNSVSPGLPYEIRYDLTFNGVINTIDVGRFVPFLNKSCTP